MQIFLTIFGMAVLGRILSPEIFGLFALVMAVNKVVLPLLDVGLKPAYIKLEEVTKMTKNIFFSTYLGLGIVLLLLVCLAAPVAEKIYEEPILDKLLYFHAFSLLILSFGLQPQTELIRENKYFVLQCINISATIIGLGVGILMAIYGFGIWSLVVKFFIEVCFRTLFSYLIVKPSYSLVGPKAFSKYKQTFLFVKDIGLSRFIIGIINSIDSFAFGKIFNTSILGNYNRSFELAIKPDNIIRTSLSTPILSHIGKKSQLEARKHYFFICTIIIIIAGTPCFYFMFFGDLLTIFLLGEQWGMASEFTKLLGVFALGKLFYGLITILHLNEIKANELTRYNTLSILPYAIGIFSALKTNDPNLSIGIFAISFFIFWFIIFCWTIKKFKDNKPFSFIFRLVILLIILFIAAFVNSVFFGQVMISSSLITIPLSLFLIYLITISFVYLFQRETFFMIFNFVRARI